MLSALCFIFVYNCGLTVRNKRICYVMRMRRNGYLGTSGVNLDTTVRFPDPDFLLVENFGDLATFSVDYCILYSKCPSYFYFRFV